MKVLVLGAGGMAGHMVVRYLSDAGHQVTTSKRQNSDFDLTLSDTRAVESRFNELNKHHDFVINCIGMLVQDSISNPPQSILVNSWFPRFLETFYRDTDTKVVHISTDCVFNGAAGNYTEEDTPTETNMYGRSKALGEINNNKDITFRTSIIGPEVKNGTGLLYWFMNNSPAEVMGWNNAWWNGITTLELAKCINTYMYDPNISGLYHLTSAPPENHIINKRDLLRLINDVFELRKIVSDGEAPKDINKVLVNTRYSEMDFSIPSYDTMIRELKEFYYGGK